MHRELVSVLSACVTGSLQQYSSSENTSEAIRDDEISVRKCLSDASSKHTLRAGPCLHLTPALLFQTSAQTATLSLYRGLCKGHLVDYSGRIHPDFILC
ncbi:hypothetical protein AALO_G00042720 [Alosa alosa]|uniref:Uncharacterized protein n=1 Tax=Alosa alosa TaxID=278164 RepID=A0AAV6H8H1_9TELE|nr:hypothetical protein AALO_G00042720 [Alosa alosa]